MSDHQQSADAARPAGFEVGGEPGDAFDVQVVGGLVEGDHIPVTDQQLSQLHTSALTARQCGDGCLPVEIGHQSGDHIAHLRVARPLVLGPVSDQDVGYRLRRIEGVGLLEGGHLQPAAVGHPARVGCDPAGQKSQQTRLTLAVAAHDPDPVTVIDAHGDGLEDHLRRVRQVQRLAAQQVCHREELRLWVRYQSSGREQRW